MVWINQARDRKKFPDAIGGISWIGLDRPAATCFMPFYVGVNGLPKEIETMNLTEFDRDNSAWWAFNFVANYATIKYCYMIKDIKKKQGELELAALRQLDSVEQKALSRYREGDVPACLDILTSFCQKNLKNEKVRQKRMAGAVDIRSAPRGE